MDLAELGDKSSEMEALLQLGEITKRGKAYKEAQQFYEDARRLAEHQGELGRLKRINCIIGVCEGELGLDQYFRGLRSRARRRSTVPAILDL